MTLDNLVIENARIMFRNFSGKETKFTRAGTRTFGVRLDEETADRLLNDGWNVKRLDPRDEGDSPIYYLSVAVNFDNYPPKLWQVTKHSKILLDEDSVDNLDYADFNNIDLIIRPRQYEVNGRTGIKAYLKTGYFVIEEDEFSDKYSNWGGPDEDVFR